ncbi:HD domain-containing protein [Rhizobium lemnae]|uniref:HD domain-containing protein n=1 Tax=Rhizobium lemnae TaxID=1214924 RepID=A0ABV8ECC8_9HYPH|nr:HD domain-containing protein [Rhizobium lemnae]MCJ8508195.1 HD domain-containing protein [Rhizobium lemnae]
MMDKVTDLFAPFQDLAAALLPHAFDADDGAHDTAHLARVFKNGMRIHGKEGGDADVIAAAVLLHDCVSVEKNSPDRSKASRLAALKATSLLTELGGFTDRIEKVAHAIEAHSFSAGIQPKTIEAKILQDADRLDAIGMIGAARCFYISGRMGSSLYDAGDPRASDRHINGNRFALDHFPEKLFKLAEGFQTQTGQALAQARHARLKLVYDTLLDEIENG